jgi:hypothetical protein
LLRVGWWRSRQQAIRYQSAVAAKSIIDGDADCPDV